MNDTYYLICPMVWCGHRRTCRGSKRMTYYRRLACIQVTKFTTSMAVHALQVPIGTYSYRKVAQKREHCLVPGGVAGFLALENFSLKVGLAVHIDRTCREIGKRKMESGIRKQESGNRKQGRGKTTEETGFKSTAA